MQTNRFHTDPTDSHVSLERLRQYQANALPMAERHQVEKHLLDCDLCADLLEGLETSPPPVTQRAVQDINRRLAASLARKRKSVPFYAQPKHWSVAAAVLLFILTGAVVVYYNLTNIRQAEKPVAIEPFGAQPKTQTVIKPASPQVAQNSEPVIKVDSVLEKPGLALHTPPVAAPALRIRPRAASATSTQPGSLPALGETDVTSKQEISTTGQVVESPDTPAFATAPQTGSVEQQLAGKTAGVASNSKLRKNKAPAGTMLDNAVVEGRLIKGKVTDEKGEVLPGVNVVVKGTFIGTVTNAQGEYNLPLPNGVSGATLVFNFIGYTTTEKQINTTASPMALNVAMEADTKALSEVVVVGYGTLSKSGTNNAVAHARPNAGFKAFRNYIRENLKYPAAAKARKINGRVVVEFTVNPDGSLSNFKVIKSLSPECDAEALHLIKEGPGWEPTQKNNRVVTDTVRVAIRFKPTR